jgi:hypothetical protein
MKTSVSVISNAPYFNSGPTQQFVCPNLLQIISYDETHP